MRIKMLTSIAGSDMAARPGEIVDVEAGLAARLIASDQAERVDGAAEAAAKPSAAQTATTAPARPRRRGRRG